jgi:hypothetical protein
MRSVVKDDRRLWGIYFCFDPLPIRENLSANVNDHGEPA